MYRTYRYVLGLWVAAAKAICCIACEEDTPLACSKCIVDRSSIIPDINSSLGLHICRKWWVPWCAWEKSAAPLDGSRGAHAVGQSSHVTCRATATQKDLNWWCMYGEWVPLAEWVAVGKPSQCSVNCHDSVFERSTLILRSLKMLGRSPIAGVCRPPSTASFAWGWGSKKVGSSWGAPSPPLDLDQASLVHADLLMSIG